MDATAETIPGRGTGVTDDTILNQEYYELILKHRIHNRDGDDPFIEEPITIKVFTGPFKSDEDWHACLIDEMCRKLKEFWLSTREEIEHSDVRKK